MKKRAIATTTKVPTVTEDPAMREQEQAREDAFNAEPDEWQGQPLQAYGSGRESLFTQIRAAAGAPPIRETVETTDAFFPDAIRVLYLCLHQPEEWREHRRDAAAWLEHIEAWADDAVPLHLKAEACAVAMGILSRAYANEHVPVKRHGKTPAGKK